MNRWMERVRVAKTLPDSFARNVRLDITDCPTVKSASAIRLDQRIICATMHPVSASVRAISMGVPAISARMVSIATRIVCVSICKDYVADIFVIT